MTVDRLHHVVEDLREHRGREEADRPQRLCARVDQVMADVGRQHEDAARTDREDAVITAQLAGSGDDILSLFGLIGVPAEPAARLDLEDDRRRLVRPVSPIGDEGPLPTNGIITVPMDLGAWQVERRYRVHTIPFTFSWVDLVFPARQPTRRAPRQASCSGRSLAYT